MTPVAAGVAALTAQLESATGVRVRAGVPVAPYTTMRVGGPADLLVEAPTVAALVAALDFARDHGVPAIVIGRGSDLVVADGGIRGLVVVNRSVDLEVRGERLEAASGVQLARAATAAERAGLSGLEFGLAIPGSVGGAVWANAGAHGSEIANVLETAELLLPDGRRQGVRAADLRFSYRDSVLKAAPTAATPAAPATTATPAAPATTATPAARARPATVVLRATFHLTPAEPTGIRARSEEIRRWRREHQPLTQPSAGSIFRNPPGDSAGRLIDAAGLKGATEGGAAISRKHANFIVNTGSATAAEIRRLALRAAEQVRVRFGVELAFEVEFAGDWAGAQEEAR